MAAYYNECDRFAAAWLRALIAEGHIAAGDVDERDIKEVQPQDLRGYRQCHFFAGIGGWSYALRLAGVPDDARLWTGSCPCQPFSVAGKRRGADDDRHLWPEWFRLIRQLRPPVCFGEQVASPDGLHWLDLVSADLEGAAYAFAAADLCAAGIGAPHLRQRLFFVADAFGSGGYDGWRRDTGRAAEGERGDAPLWGRDRISAEEHGAVSLLADPELSERWPERSACDGLAGSHSIPQRQEGSGRLAGGVVRGFWGNAEWIPCIDGKARAVEPGTFPLAHRSPARVGRLRGYGNAIVAPLAAEFIKAYCEARGDPR